MSTTFTKDAEEFLDYKHDWTAALATGETVTASVWTVPSGLTVGSGAYAPSFTTTSCTVWLGGGTEGNTYRVHNTMTTSQGRIFNRYFEIKIRDL